MSGHPVAESATDQFEHILGAMGDGVYVIDEEGIVTHANEALLELTGYDESEFVGESAELLLPEADVEQFEESIRRLLSAEGNATETVEASLQTRSGGAILTEITLTLLRDDDGSYEGSVGVVRDVSERLERERELEAAKRQFEAVFEDPHLLVGLLDTDGMLIDANQTALEVVDTDRDDVLGAYFPETPWWGANVESDVAEWIDRAAGGEYVEFDAYHERPGGEEIAVEGIVRPVTDENGEVVSLVVSAQDVTQRRQRQRELERFETLIELMPDTVIIADLEGNMLDIYGGYNWSGYSAEGLTGSDFSTTVTDETRERAQEVVSDLIRSEDREKATYEHEVLSPDGSVRPFENHITVLEAEDGEIEGTMSVLRDISDRKARERELERQNERLEEFANIVSHDLRNPLNVAMGTLEVLQDDYDDERLARVTRTQERMRDIIEDVLALAREGADVDGGTPVSLAEVARDAWANVESNDAKLSVTADVSIDADRSRLQRLFENLFRNAVEHGGGDPTVEVGWTATDDGVPSFYVSDDGPGLPDDERDEIFESGYSRSEQGTGLGLAIVRRIAEAHEWTVELTDSATGGARFEFHDVEPA